MPKWSQNARENTPFCQFCLPIVSQQCYVRVLAKFFAVTALYRMTTYQVKDEIIIPATLAKQYSYMELVQDQCDDDGKPFVGTATVFVSHAFGVPFLDSYFVMRAYAEQHPDAYFWFNPFMTNQHRLERLPSTWWSTTFKDTIRSIGHVLLVLSPWNDPVPLKRAWCLWEILCAIDQDEVELQIELPMYQSTLLKNGFYKDVASVSQSLARIDASQAESFLQSDKDMIFRAIEDTVGFLQVNSVIKSALRSWYIYQVTKVLAKGSEQNASMHVAYRQLLRDLEADEQTMNEFEANVHQ